MNPADDEINLLLPLFFGFFVILIGAVVTTIVWILHKTKVINFSQNSNLRNVLKATILSIIGVVVGYTIISLSISVFHIVKHYLTQ